MTTTITNPTHPTITSGMFVGYRAVYLCAVVKGQARRRRRRVPVEPVHVHADAAATLYSIVLGSLRAASIPFDDVASVEVGMKRPDGRDEFVIVRRVHGRWYIAL